MEDSPSSDGDEYDNDVVVYTADEILRFGLQLLGSGLFMEESSHVKLSIAPHNLMRCCNCHGLGLAK